MKPWPLLLVAVIACETQLDLGHDAPSADDDGDDDGASLPDASEQDASTSTPSTSCSDVCSRVIACGILGESNRAECVARCNAGSTAVDRACIMQSSCSAMVTACGIPEDGTSDPDDGGSGGDPQEQFYIQVCQDSCDHAHFSDCIDSPAHAACRERCTTAASGPRESFTACMDTTAGNDCSAILDCVDQFSS